MVTDYIGISNARVAWPFEPIAPRPDSQAVPDLNIVRFAPAMVPAPAYDYCAGPRACRSSRYSPSFRQGTRQVGLSHVLRTVFGQRRVVVRRALTVREAAALLCSPPPLVKILPPTCLESLPPPDLKGQIFVESLWHPARDLKNNDAKAELAVVCEEDNNMDYFSATDGLGEDSGIDDQDAWVVREDTDDQDAHVTADRDLNHDSNNTDDSVDGGLVSTHRLDTAGLFLQAGAVAGLPSVYLSPSTPTGPCLNGASPSEIPSSADSTSDEC